MLITIAIFSLFAPVLVSMILLVSFGGPWKIFKKAGRSGWKSLVPFYNLYILIKIVGRPSRWLVYCFVPLVNILLFSLISHDLSKSFNRSVWFTIGLMLLPPVFLPVLGFGNYEYAETEPEQHTATAALACLVAIALVPWSSLLLYNAHSVVRDVPLLWWPGFIFILVLSFGIAYGFVESYKRSSFLLIFAIIISVAAYWALFPVPCDTHESFHDIDNKSCECNGIEITHYTPGMMDGTATDFCIGPNSPVGSSNGK
jgi:hypothetical protein